MAMIIAINLSLRCQAWLARKSPTSMGKSHMKKWASKPCLITYSNMASIEPQRHIFETFWWFLKSCSSNKVGFQIGSKCPIVQNPPILKCVLFQFQPSRSFFAGFFEGSKSNHRPHQPGVSKAWTGISPSKMVVLLGFLPQQYHGKLGFHWICWGIQ